MLEAVGKARGTEKCDAGRNALQGEHEISLSPQAKERECSLGSPSRAPSALEPQEAAPRQPHGFTAGGFLVDVASAPSRPRLSSGGAPFRGQGATGEAGCSSSLCRPQVCVCLGRTGAPRTRVLSRVDDATSSHGQRSPDQ